MKKAYIHHFNYISPLGANANDCWLELVKGNTGIKKHTNFANLQQCYAALIPDIYFDNELEAYDVSGFSRILKLAIAVLHPIIQKKPIHPNSTLILSTTKGDITALKNNNIPEASIPFLAEQISVFYGFRRKPIIVSNACVSGALALATAKRLIQIDMIEDAYVIGIDEVTEFVISGFNSFQAMSSKPCIPYDSNRSGVTLGEAAAAAYISSENLGENIIQIAGDGAINDANHISGPSRTGEGLVKSIQSALKEANIQSHQIDYISSHGTATIFNDEMEAIAFNRLNLENTNLSSLKGYFGHTLGTSGLLESLVTCQMMLQNTALANIGYTSSGVSKPINVLTKNITTEINYALKTASGFGGSNTALIFKKMT